MYDERDVLKAREDVSKHLGSKVRVRFNTGKRKMNTKDGVLTNAYASIFLVDLMTDAHTYRSTAYSYKDLLTQNVSITIL